METLKKYLNDKYIFLKLYCIVSILYTLGMLLNDYINENVLSDTLRLCITNVLFASLIKVDYFMIVSFDGVIFAILIVIHFGLVINNLFKEKFGCNDIKKAAVIFIITLVLYIVFRLICKSNLPFSLYEATIFGTFVYLCENIIKVKKITL